MKSETSRRSFLGAAAGMAGLSAIEATPSSAAVVPEPWGMKLGIATYSLRMFDRPTAIEMLKKFQVKYVSIKDVHLRIGAPPEETKAGRAEFDAAGLVVTSGGNVDMTKGTTVEDLRKQFEYAKAAGLPMMVCAPTHENIKAVEQLVKEYDIRIAIHNHGPEDKHFPTPQSVLEVGERVLVIEVVASHEPLDATPADRVAALARALHAVAALCSGTENAVFGQLGDRRGRRIVLERDRHDRSRLQVPRGPARQRGLRPHPARRVLRHRRLRLVEDDRGHQVPEPQLRAGRQGR